MVGVTKQRSREWRGSMLMWPISAITLAVYAPDTTGLLKSQGHYQWALHALAKCGTSVCKRMAGKDSLSGMLGAAFHPALCC